MRKAFAFDRLAADLGLVALLAAVYFAAAKLSLLAAIPPGYATAVWPPSGIALAAVVLFGQRALPGVWLGATLVNITVESSFIAASLIGIGNTLEALAGAVLLRRFGVPREFKRGADAFTFLAIAVLSATVAATVASIPLALVHALGWRDLAWNWWTWWQGDTMGIILVTPLILSWWGFERQAWPPRRIAEGASLVVGLLLIGQLIFSDIAVPYSISTLPLAFLVLPFVMWAAIRFGQREVTMVIAAVSALAIVFTVQDRGPFAAGSLNLSLLFLLAFMSTVAITGLVLNAVVRESARVTASLNEALRQLQEHAITDPLTGLYNRRFLEDYLPRELARAGLSRTPLAAIMLDLDYFKLVNDVSGRAAGDEVLKAIAVLLKRDIRASDVACRYGGEEFMLLLPETSLAAAQRKAELVRLEVERNHGILSGVTVSLGVAMFPAHGVDAESLVREADQAMYEAKQAGRNRVATSYARATSGDAGTARDKGLRLI